MLYEVITGDHACVLRDELRGELAAGEHRRLELPGLGRGEQHAAVRCERDEQRMRRITSYNVCYTKLLRVWKTCGPGCSPCSRNAPRMIAVAPLPGMPIVTSGISAPPTEDVAAVCGATIPSGIPVPSSARRRPYCSSVP